jgi:hypothetical protein
MRYGLLVLTLLSVVLGGCSEGVLNPKGPIAAGDAGSKPGERVMRNLTAVAFKIAKGSIAAYYPEANALVALDHYDVKCGTPSYKSTPVLLRASSN